jgi:hypothetical protein
MLAHISKNNKGVKEEQDRDVIQCYPQHHGFIA